MKKFIVMTLITVSTMLAYDSTFATSQQRTTSTSRNEVASPEGVEEQITNMKELANAVSVVLSHGSTKTLSKVDSKIYSAVTDNIKALTRNISDFTTAYTKKKDTGKLLTALESLSLESMHHNISVLERAGIPVDELMEAIKNLHDSAESIYNSTKTVKDRYPQSLISYYKIVCNITELPELETTHPNQDEQTPDTDTESNQEIEDSDVREEAKSNRTIWRAKKPPFHRPKVGENPGLRRSNSLPSFNKIRK